MIHYNLIGNVPCYGMMDETEEVGDEKLSPHQSPRHVAAPVDKIKKLHSRASIREGATNKISQSAQSYQEEGNLSQKRQKLTTSEFIAALPPLQHKLHPTTLASAYQS